MKAAIYFGMGAALLVASVIFILPTGGEVRQAHFQECVDTVHAEAAFIECLSNDRCTITPENILRFHEHQRFILERCTQ